MDKKILIHLVMDNTIMGGLKLLLIIYNFTRVNSYNIKRIKPYIIYYSKFRK